ncbi:hypothetical protein OG562_18260 [Streptomyces sp. NBC_01275]|uniref:hypothetical protein n=1 Tax=Streptomyces sp. NBC_01275 TaxID=2903807 RepID=UPI002254CB54|nr:hypothetical protein [Streptomyces sp. NBC_01275]MCX4762884.1 hypothetical protein [Streptomyces sp. NBC_01275]
MENSVPEDPAQARAALDSANAARAALADRAAAPWWYHTGLGLGVGLVFASIDVGGSLVPSGVIVGGIVLPAALTVSVARSRGVSVNRSLTVPSTRQLNGLYLIVLIVLGGLGLTLKLAADLPGAMSAAGVLALALTVYVSRRNDAALRHDLLRRT